MLFGIYGQKTRYFGWSVFIVGISFPLNFVILLLLVDMQQNMGLIGFDFSNSSDSLLSALFELESNFYIGKVFSANCGFEYDKDICARIYVFEWCSKILDFSVNCNAIETEQFEIGVCDAFNLFFNCEILLAEIGVCGAKTLFIFYCVCCALLRG